MRHHPGVQILAIGIADSHGAPIAVPAAFLACDGAAVDLPGQGVRSTFSASPRLTIAVTGLSSLWGVDAVEPDALAVDLQRVAVDDAGVAR